MKHGTVTPVSCGTLQGIYRPQVRVYYETGRHGILFETLTKSLRCRSRKRAVQLAREWIKTDECRAQIAAVLRRVS